MKVAGAHLPQQRQKGEQELRGAPPLQDLLTLPAQCATHHSSACQQAVCHQLTDRLTALTDKLHADLVNRVRQALLLQSEQQQPVVSKCTNAFTRPIRVN